jgi:predicted GNAT family N-acyltransferase
MNLLTIRLANQTDMAAVYAIRTAVFQVEQGVPTDLEFDGEDAGATHLMAQWDKQPVGTARLRRVGDRTVKLERVAVLSDYRGRGIGHQIVVTALNLVAAQSVNRVKIHAQLATRSFYENLGFIAEGDEFVEAGIWHIQMSKLKMGA